MLKVIGGLPDGVVGVEAVGEVTAQDYERILIPYVERVLHTHGKIRFLYQIEAGFTGFTAGALWDDAKIGLHYWKKFERCAVVTDVKWIRDSVGLFRVVFPCPVKVFRDSELAEAKAWLIG